MSRDFPPGKQADVAERRTVRFDEAVFGNMGEGLYTTDENGLLVTMNPAAEQLLGWTLDELRGRPVHEVIHSRRSDDTPVPSEACRIYNVLNTGKAVLDVDDEFVRKDGTFIAVRYTSSPLIESGRVLGLVVVFRDATQQRQIQRDQEFLFGIADKIRTCRKASQLLADIPELVGGFLNAHRCLFNEIDQDANLATVRSDYHRSGNSVVGRHKLSDYSEIAGVSLRSGQTVVNRDTKNDPRTAGYFTKSYGPAQELSYVAVPMLRDGKWVASLWCSDDKPRNWADREVGLLENVAERTWAAVERLRAEEALRRSEEMFSTLVENAPFGVYMIDADFRLRSINAGAREVFSGIDPLIGRDFEEVLRLIWEEPFATEAIEHFRHTLRTGESFVSPPITENRANIEEIQSYDWQIHRITLPDGGHSVVCYFYDLSAQKRLEASVRRAADMDSFRVELTDTLRPLADPEQIQMTASRVLGERLNATRVAYFEVFEANYHVACDYVTSDFASIKGEHSIEAFGDWLRDTYLAGVVAISSDIEQDVNLSRSERSAFKALGIVAHIGVPVIKDGKLVGGLGVHSAVEREWKIDEIELVKETAERTWAAVERARAEKALGESAEKFRSLFESIDEGFVIVEIIFDDDDIPRDYRFVQANPSFTKLTGLPEDAIGKTARELVPDLEDFWFEKYGGVALTGESVRFEHRSEAMGRWFDVYASRIGGSESRQVAIVFNNVTERKLAERALRESEARFRNMADHAPMMVWITDTSGSCTYLSESWYEFTGQTEETGLGLGWLEAVHPDDRNSSADIFMRANAKGESFHLEYRLKNAEGKYRWAIDAAQPRLGENGEFLGYIGSVIDITTRKEAEEKLRESDERFQMAQSAGGVGVWDWDLAANRTYWSDTMWRFYGESERSVNPDDAFWTAHLHPDDRNRVKEHLTRVVNSTDVQYRDEFRIVGAEGRTIWIESMANIVRRDDGRAVRVYGVNVDITERKLNEERIKRNETQLRLVTDSLPALIAYIDKEKRYQFVNGTYTEWFGEKPDQLIGRTIKDVLGPRAFDTLKPLMEKALAGEPVSLHTEINYKIGSKFVHLNYVPDIAEDGTVRGFFSLINDLTDIKRSEDLLRSTEERMALVMENVADYAILSTNTEGIIESWNIGAEKIFGYAADEIIGKSGKILFTAEDVARGVHLNEMLVARQKGRAIDERWHVRKGGSRFFASGVMIPLIVGKRLTGYAKIAADLTERKRHAEELQSAHDELELRVFQRTKELGEMNELLRREVEQRKESEQHRVKLLHRIVSAQEAERKRIARDIHDQFGQRLTALRLKLASLHDICADNDVAAKRVERLQEIATMLDSEVSFLAFELRPSVLDDLGLEEALRAYAREWSGHFDIELKFHSNGLTGKRYGREAETQLYRIAQEALNNIAKHAGPAEVTLLMEQTSEFLVLVIEDTGSGFDADALSSKYGKGLGLVGMRERSTLIGAELEIESAEGSGTTIFLRLPHRKRGQKNGR